jgi:hypothetical protein
MITRKDLEHMSLEEQAMEEAKRAAEYGITIEHNVLISTSFSAEASTPIQFSAGSTSLPTPEEAQRTDQDFQIVSTDFSRVPDLVQPIMFRDSPRALLYSIETNLDKLSQHNQSELLPRIMEQLRDLQLQSESSETFSEVQERIAHAIFGTNEFQDLRSESGGAIPPQE